jgi:Ca2+-binding EF-hand superfamily protein/adenylate kinase family enzyme
MSQADLVELIHDLQLQLSKRGAAGYRTLELSFVVNDLDRNGTFDFQEIEAILGKAGLFLKRQNLTKLYRYFDREQNERVYFPDLLEAIRGPLSARRRNIIDQVFDALDETGHGAVDIEKILQSFNPTRHPQVLSGEKKAAELIREFNSAFDGAGATNNGAVTRDEFIKFYAGIGAAIPYDDDYFVNILERCWGVKESIPASLRPTLMSNSKSPAAETSRTPLLARVRSIFREKVRQKTINSKSEVENLRLVLKHFDLSSTGQIDFINFRRALERFGIHLDEKTMSALFAEFDLGNGRIDYLQFATALYEEDVTSATHHQFNRSQQLAASQRLQESARPSSRQYVDAEKVLVSSPAPVAASSSEGEAAAAARAATLRRTLNQKERENSVLPTVIFLFGGPSVGTATQASRIIREFGFVGLSLPALILAERQNRASQVGKMLNEADRIGSTVPNEILCQLLQRTIQENVNRGSLYFLVDHFPTSVSARQTWDRLMTGKVETPFVIYLEASQNVMEQRIAARAKTNGQSIDHAAVKANFQAFAQATIPVVNSYGEEGRLQVVDASGTPDVVYAQIQKIIAEL